MAPRSLFLAAALLGATLVQANPSPFALPKAFAQSGDLPECLSDCLLEYGTSTSAQQCFGDVDPAEATTEEQMVIINCWCTDTSRAGIALDRCTASCRDGGAEYWTAVCESVSDGPVVEEPIDEEPIDEEPIDEEPIDEEPIEEEETSTTPSRPTRTYTTAIEEETDFIDPTETDEPFPEEEEEPTETVEEEEEPTTTRVRRPTASDVEEQEDSSAHRFLPHAGALAAGVLAAVVAL